MCHHIALVSAIAAVAAPPGVIADPVTGSCEGITLEVTCPTSGVGAREIVTVANSNDRLVETRAFVQRAWNTNNSLRLTVRSFADATRQWRFGSAGLGDVELEYVRSAASHHHTSRAAGIDLTVPTGARAFSDRRFAYEPFYATYTRAGSHLLLLTFAQTRLESGPRANSETPLDLEWTAVALLKHGYYAGTRLSSVRNLGQGSARFVERFQIGATGDRSHVAVYLDLPLDPATRTRQFAASYGLMYNVIHE